MNFRLYRELFTFCATCCQSFQWNNKVTLHLFVSHYQNPASRSFQHSFACISNHMQIGTISVCGFQQKVINFIKKACLLLIKTWDFLTKRSWTLAFAKKNLCPLPMIFQKSEHTSLNKLGRGVNTMLLNSQVDLKI